MLDAILENDPDGRVACETLVTTGLAIVAGEITISCYVDVPRIVRNTIKEIGYTRAKFGFDYLTCGVVTAIQEQSPDIALGYQTAQEALIGLGQNAIRRILLKVFAERMSVSVLFFRDKAKCSIGQ